MIHFNQSVYNATINETGATPGFITFLCVSMYHPNITYSINPTGLPFSVNSLTGQLSTTNDLDYDTLDEGFEFFSFNASCSDSANTTTALVEININPVNEFHPEIVRISQTSFAIDENTPNGTLILSSLPGGQALVVVEDQDRGPDGEVRFILDPMSELDDHFSLDMLTGNLTLIRPVDFETENNLSTSSFHVRSVNIGVCNPQTPFLLCEQISLRFFLVATDDNEPTFLTDAYVAEVNETTAMGSAVLTLECSDIDVQVGIVSSIALADSQSEVADMFSLGNLSASGSTYSSVLILDGKLDYDRLDQMYLFQVTCNDTLHSARANVTIAVLPENDEEPIFEKLSYQFTASQAAPEGSVVGRVSAVDDDVDSSPFPISYALHHVNHTFLINATTGEIVVNASLQNLPANYVVVFNVSASDEEFVTYVEVAVTITQGNFHHPVFQPNHNMTVIVVDKLAEIGEHVVTLICTDQDTGPEGNITYSLTGTNDTFSIDSVTGVVSVSAILTRCDITATVEYQATVQCEDHGMPSQADQMILILQVYQNNSILPSILDLDSIAVTETAEVGYEVALLTATDLDTCVLSFSIVNQTQPGTFIIETSNSKTSILRLASPLDYENTTSHLVTVEVLEVKQVPDKPQRDVVIVAVTVNVVDENDNRPQLLSSAEVTLNIADLQAVGTILTVVRCEDADSGLNAELIYTLHTDLAEARQILNISSSGSLTVARLLRLPDFVLTANYTVFISCTDRGSPPLSSSDNATVFVHITKADIEPPVFNSTNLTISVPENATLNTAIYTIMAYDVDSPDVAYSLSGDSAPFTLSPTTSQLVLSAPLDRETTPTYTVTLVATEILGDGSHGNSTMANLTIHVSDINDNAPSLLSLTALGPVPDTARPGTPVATVQCTDSDTGTNAELQYAISPEEFFTIDAHSGEVSINSSVTLPLGTFIQQHLLEVECSDSGTPSLATNTTLTVEVFRNDNQPPHITSFVAVDVSEAAQVGTEVVTFQALDNDTPSLLYRLDNETAPGVFSINETSGILSLTETLDRETVPKYVFLVVVEEVRVAPGPPQNSTAVINVTVLDTNDNRPYFEPANNTVSVDDRADSATVLMTVECRDEDEGTNAEVMYEILPQHTLFAVDKNGSILVAMPLHLPNFTLSAAHTIFLQCTDAGSPALTSETGVNVTINITRADREPPYVNISRMPVSLPESSSNGTAAATLAVFDVDSPAVSLTITSQTIPETFSIFPSSPYNHPHYPQLTLNGTLDREDTDTHHIELLATAVPATSPSQNSSFRITVNVQDVNDNAPVCREGSRVVINAGFYSHTILQTLSCSDLDKGLNQQLTYELDNSSLPQLSDGQLTVDSTSGELALEGRIAEGTYLITVVVSDQGNPPLHTNETVEVVARGGDGGERLPLIIIIILAVVVFLVVVGVACGCGLCCCCYWCRVHRYKRKSYLNGYLL